APARSAPQRWPGRRRGGCRRARAAWGNLDGASSSNIQTRSKELALEGSHEEAHDCRRRITARRKRWQRSTTAASISNADTRSGWSARCYDQALEPLVARRVSSGPIGWL